MRFSSVLCTDTLARSALPRRILGCHFRIRFELFHRSIVLQFSTLLYSSFPPPRTNNLYYPNITGIELADMLSYHNLPDHSRKRKERDEVYEAEYLIPPDYMMELHLARKKQATRLGIHTPLKHDSVFDLSLVADLCDLCLVSVLHVLVR